MVQPHSPPMRLAAAAVREVFGKDPILVRGGGSIPVVDEFARTLKVPTILLGFGLPDDNLHAPNEKFDLGMMDRGMRTIALLLQRWGDRALHCRN